MPQGTVSWFSAGKGFGFVAPDGGGPDVFLHAKAVPDATALGEGVRVEFDVRQSDRGPQAERVRVVGAAADRVPPRPAGTVLGTVSWFGTDKGFGFVTPDDGGPDVFVHVSALDGLAALLEGDRVEVDVRQGDRGPQAERVRLLEDDPRPDPGGEVVLQGTVSWYSAEKGFGFLVPDDLFVHGSAVHAVALEEGSQVEFVVRQGERGPQAEQVRPLPGGAAPRRERPGRDRAAPAAPAATPSGSRGRVAWFDAAKGFGFLTPDDGGPDLFVHVSAVAGGRLLEEGEPVAYAVEDGPRGPVAADVEPLGEV